MIKARYNESIIQKARALAREAEQYPSGERNAYCQHRVGLSYPYLKRLGKDFKNPSARVIMNLGYDLYVRDNATGEFSKLEMDVPCDWNPANPRMNPSSTSVSPKELSATSTVSE